MQKNERLVFLIVVVLSAVVAVQFAAAANVTSTTNNSTTSTSTSTSVNTTSVTTTSATTSILPLVFNSLYISSQLPTQGQTELITATVSGGLPPYLFTFLAENSLTSNTIFTSSVTNSLASNSVGFVLPSGANDIGTIAINVVIADSANSPTAGGSNSITVSANTVNATTSPSSTSANSSNISASSSSSTSTMPTTSAQSGINTTFVSSLLTSYASGLVNGTSTAQLNGTSALSLDQLNLITLKLRGAGVSISHVRVNKSYGSVSQGGKLQRAGKTLYYVQYNGNSSATEYSVSVVKRVPDLHVKIGNFTTNSAMGNVTLLQSVYTPAIVNGVPHLYPQGTYSINPQIFSSTLNNNTLNYTYSIYTGSTLRAHGTTSGSGIGKGFGFSGISVSQPTKIVFDAQGNSNYSSIDPTVYVFYSSSNINVNPPTGTVLSGDLVCGSLTVSSGNTLTTNGFNILCNSTITDDGTIDAGNPANGGTGVSGTGGVYTSSYAGPGGGGAGSDGNGAEPTSLPSTPTVTNAQIQTWYAGPFSAYFSAGGGGASCNGDVGGSGSYGLYMQGNSITVAGTINAIGVTGATGTVKASGAGGTGGATLAAGGAGGPSTHNNPCGGGGGGGGVVLLAYNGGTAPSTTGISVTGGLGGGGTFIGGTGGGGKVLTPYSYSGSGAPIVVLRQLYISPATIGSAILDVGQSYTFSTTAFNGLSPYTGNWQWVAPNSVSSTNTINAQLPTATNALSLTLSPLSDTDLQYTWSGTNYQVTTSGTTIEGLWAFNGFVVDNSLDTSTGNTVNTANTPQITINTKPGATLTPSSSSPGPSSLETYTIGVNGGTGQFTAELYNVSGGKQACADGKTPPCNVIITSPGGSNTIAFTVGTSGSDTYNAIVTDLGTTNPYTFNSIQNTITISSATCVPVVSNTLVNFGSVRAGYFAAVANAVTVNDIGSTAAAYIYLYSIYGTDLSGNWVYLSNSFTVSNTLWTPTDLVNTNEPSNTLTNTISTNTLLYVSPTISNTIYFGVNIPAGQHTGSYEQGITVSLSC